MKLLSFAFVVGVFALIPTSPTLSAEEPARGSVLKIQSLASQPPFSARLVKSTSYKKFDGSVVVGMTLELADGSTRRYFSSAATPAEQRVVAYLNTINTNEFRNFPSAVDEAAKANFLLIAIENLGPFRGTVIRRELVTYEDGTELACLSLARDHDIPITVVDLAPSEDSKRFLNHLEEGQTYQFPHVYYLMHHRKVPEHLTSGIPIPVNGDVGIPAPRSASDSFVPQNPEEKAMDLLVGVWSVEGAPTVRILKRWSADGKHVRSDTISSTEPRGKPGAFTAQPNMGITSVMSFDRKSKLFQSVTIAQGAATPPGTQPGKSEVKTRREGTWDEGTRTFTWYSTGSREISATVTSLDPDTLVSTPRNIAGRGRIEAGPATKHVRLKR
ncbi:hypothetical protein [Roseimicrobium sp. ORNL1]|uniref:hypothetical protein n=1 Tax=Roseimicrobium sp. ORNL1 TaxID=2711231 RepID=UPI0013E1D06C|nr:hypothetical protein [Roseimicrobium sp. ORNL1]QIF02650.1 hypothetical protein G5S37_14320 [Roseimicrobium sp. ORNL1]